MICMSSFAEERLAAKRAVSKQIRQRSSAMERDVARYLIGRRVPMSGAGSMKGDCEVETDKIGRIFIECKYSASHHPLYGPRVRINFRWFDKMHRDAVSMKARFAALVIKYHDQRLSQYVILSTDVLTQYDDPNRISDAVVIDAKDKSGIELFKSVVDAALVVKPVAILRCNRGDYVIMPIALFKEIIHGDPVSI